MNKLFLIGIVFLISACSSKSSSIDGTYINESIKRSLTFRSDGTAFESNSAGLKIEEFTYSVDGTQININGSKSPYFLQNDGSIAGVALGRFVKK